MFQFFSDLWVSFLTISLPINIQNMLYIIFEFIPVQKTLSEAPKCGFFLILHFVWQANGGAIASPATLLSAALYWVPTIGKSQEFCKGISRPRKSLEKCVLILNLSMEDTGLPHPGKVLESPGFFLLSWKVLESPWILFVSPGKSWKMFIEFSRDFPGQNVKLFFFIITGTL